MQNNALILCTICRTAIEAKVEIAFLGNKTILVTGRCDNCEEEREAQIRLPGIWLLRPKQAEAFPQIAIPRLFPFPQTTTTFTKE